MNSLSKYGICVVGVCMLCTPACRSSKLQSPQDVAVLQTQRRAKVEKSVGLKQSEAELHLARDAWTFGDQSACLSAVNGILEREPGHVEALLLKAEVHLANDELIEADRSIAIALSHAPKNTTAKRLSEMAQTKQLAERPPEHATASNDVYTAPLPAGAVAQTAYSSTEAGTALVADERPEFPQASLEELKPPTEVISVSDEVGSAFAEEAPGAALADPTVFPEVLQPLYQQLDVLQSWESKGLPALTEPEFIVDIEEPTAPESIATASDVMPVLLSPEEGEAYERSDVPAGSAEISDEASWGDSQPGASDFLSAIASADSVAALAAVETDLTNNPNDPQIPISAAVAALEANQPETAASIARLGIAFHPSSAGLHRTLGAALYRRDSYPSSQVALQQAVSLDNSSALAYFLLGCVSEKLGDTEAAESHFARATELDPTLADGK